MIRCRQIIALACAGIVATACTTRESVAPAAPTTAVPASTTTTTAPTTTLAPTTVVTTTTPTTTTTTPPTTTPPPSGTPTATATKFFAGGDSDGWLYVGRWTGTEWEQAVDADGQPRDPSLDATEVLIHEIGIDPIDGNVGATIELCSGTRRGPVISPNARSPEVPGFGYRSLAFAADWNTEPRPIGLVDAAIPSYRAAGEASFEGSGIDASSGSVNQIVVTDLDGDRDSESLVAFGGDGFSSLLLIDADSGAVTRVARDFPSEPDTPAGTTLADVTTTTGPPAPIDTYRILAVADLNGDGLTEFITHVWNDRNENARVVVNTYDGAEVTPVLTAGC